MDVRFWKILSEMYYYLSDAFQQNQLILIIKYLFISAEYDIYSVNITCYTHLYNERGRIRADDFCLIFC